MNEYKKYYLEASKKPKIAGYTTDGPDAPPSNLLPPDRTNVKESYNISNVLDLISEGPIEGLVDKDGRILYGETANNFMEVKPEEENVRTSVPDGYILKGFPDEILNQSYTRSVDLRSRIGKQRSRYPYHVLIMIDLSTGAAPVLSQIKEKVGKLIESQSLIKSLGYQLVITIGTVGGQGVFWSTETIVTISTGSTERIFNTITLTSQFSSPIEGEINMAQIKNKVDNFTTETLNNGRNMSPIYQSIERIVNRFIERQDPDREEESGLYARNRGTPFNAVIILSNQGDRGSYRRARSIARLRYYEQQLLQITKKITDPTKIDNRYEELDADQDFLNSLQFFLIDLGDGNATTSYQPLIDSFGGRTFDGSATIFDVFKHIGQYLFLNSGALTGGFTYRGFSGLQNQISAQDVPQLVFDGGQKYLITNVAATKVYYTSDVGFEGPWTRQEASGPAGKVYNANTLTLDKGVYFDENQVRLFALHLIM